MLKGVECGDVNTNLSLYLVLEENIKMKDIIRLRQFSHLQFLITDEKLTGQIV